MILLLASSAAPWLPHALWDRCEHTVCPDSQSTMPWGCLFTQAGTHTRATTHTCGHHGPTSCFSASSVCLLGLGVVCMELSPLKLPCNRLFVEAPQQKRSGQTDRGLLGDFWVWVCLLQLQGKCTKAAQIHRGSKTKGSIILGTSCLHPSLVQPHTTLKYRNISTAVVG